MTRIDSLLIGACLALALKTRLHALTLKFATPLFVASLFLVIADLTMQRLASTARFSVLFPLEFTVLSLAGASLIAMCLKQHSRAARLFRAPVLRFFGKYSYGLYVFHSILPMFYMTALIALTSRLHNHALGNALNSAVELGAALIVSMLSYRYFEKPILNLKRFFPPRPNVTIPANLPASSGSAWISG